MHHTYRVDKTGVSGAGENVFRKSKLLDVSKSLKKFMANNRDDGSMNVYRSVNGVPDFHKYLALYFCQLFRVFFQPIHDVEGFKHG